MRSIYVGAIAAGVDFKINVSGIPTNLLHSIPFIVIQETAIAINSKIQVLKQAIIKSTSSQ